MHSYTHIYIYILKTIYGTVCVCARARTHSLEIQQTQQSSSAYYFTTAIAAAAAAAATSIVAAVAFSFSSIRIWMSSAFYGSIMWLLCFLYIWMKNICGIVD